MAAGIGRRGGGERGGMGNHGDDSIRSIANRPPLHSTSLRGNHQNTYAKKEGYDSVGTLDVDFEGPQRRLDKHQGF